MIYLIYGNAKKDIEKYIKKEIDKLNITNISSYDEEEDIHNILEDLMYVDIFDNNKAVIVKNANNFIYNVDEEKSISEIISSLNDKIYFFLITYEDSINNKKINKTILDKSKVIPFNTLNKYQLKSYINNELNQDGYKITTDALNKLCLMYEEYPNLISNELNKLKMYKLDDKLININDVIELVSILPSSDVFSLVDACIDKNYDNIFKIANKLLSSGTDELMILSLLESQYRLYLQVMLLASQRQSISYIASVTKSHEYPIKKLYNKVSKTNVMNIENIILSLYNTEKEIKTGNIDKKEALNMFFLTI